MHMQTYKSFLYVQLLSADYSKTESCFDSLLHTKVLRAKAVKKNEIVISKLNREFLPLFIADSFISASKTAWPLSPNMHVQKLWTNIFWGNNEIPEIIRKRELIWSVFSLSVYLLRPGPCECPLLLLHRLDESM